MSALAAEETAATSASTIIGAFEATVARRGDNLAAKYRGDDGGWTQSSWNEMDRERKTLAAGLLELGLSKGDRVVILSNSCWRWMVADLAIQSCASETVPIYQSNLPHEAEYIINDCGAVVVFAEDAEQLAKLNEKRSEIGNVRKVVVFDGSDDSSDWTMKYSELMAQGEAALSKQAAALAERQNSVQGSDILTIIYTSGTTGRPKGVVLTHDNMFYEAKTSMSVGLIGDEDMQLLFLPMAHVFAKVLQCIWFYGGHQMAIDADTTRIVENLGQVKPTVMASVPRIFEKVFAKVVGGGLETPGIKGKLFKWAVGVNDRYAQLMIDGRPVPFGLEFQLSLAKKLVFSKVNQRLNDTFGGNMRFFISGGAPLPKKMAYFFSNAGILILEGYGLTETSAASCVNRPDANKIGSVGLPLPGTEVKIAEDGEILIKGPGVMREYYGRPEATSEVKLDGGWFATGDIGVIDGDGFVKITDRKKDLIVTAGGKNVAPQNIESAFKSANPLISQVMVHGDKRKYLVALVTLEPEAAQKLGAENGVQGGYEEICRSQAARDAVQATLDGVNANLAKYETIKKFAILDKDFEIGEELTPTLKVKRKFCNEKFKSILDSFYDEQVAD
ncbi:MAG: long-chain fatty acid--CoA ligase [Myxococcota bacterium]